MVFGNQSSLSFNEVQILWETLTGHFLRPEKSTFQTHWDAGSNLNRICSFLRDYNLETNLKFTSAKYSQLSQLYVLLKKLLPEKKMTASCHPALFESDKSWLLHPGECEKGRKIVKVGNPGLSWSRNLPTGKSREMVVNICENPIGSDDTCQIVSKCFSARPRLGGTRKVRLQWFDPIDQS